jgi:hypothetical protein
MVWLLDMRTLQHPLRQSQDRAALAEALPVLMLLNRSIYNTGNAPGISPDRRPCTPADLHKPGGRR